MSSEPDKESLQIGSDSDLLRIMIGSMVDYAVITLDPTGHITSWNAGAARIKGYEAAEVLGRHISILYLPEDAAADRPGRLLAQAAATGHSEDEGWRRRKDGSRFWANVVISAIRDASGTLRGFGKVTRDLSEREAAAVALRSVRNESMASMAERLNELTRLNNAYAQSEARFRRVVEAAPSAMVMIDADGTIEMVNTQAERVFGYPRDELVGRSVELLIPERFRGHHPGLRQGFFATPGSRPMGAGRDLFARRKDGTEFPVEIGLNPIEGEEGLKVLSAIVDISARRRSEERFRQVVEAAPNAMVMINAGGVIELANAQAERVFGYDRTELLGKPIETLVPERFRGHHPGLRRHYFAAPDSRPMGAGRDLFARRKDGSEFPVEIGLNPIETDDGTMILSAIVDISDRKQKEATTRQSLREKEVLLAEIHHRVKNNLQIVHSLLDLQTARIDDQAVIDMLRDSQNRVRSMALIHQTLYQSKDFARVDFASFLDSLLPTLMDSYNVAAERVSLEIGIREANIPLNQAIPCGLIVNELISNALKHAFPDGRHGRIVVQSHSSEEGDVVLTISDDGIGLGELSVENGKTLGLTLVRLLADQLKGRLVTHRSNPTSFTLTFPIADIGHE
ncbi:MAG: PAS domain S-box protein [Rhodospirillaceae bacterium]|nr:PAS domain S-box protein [Rhodospirillaceae bacterium]